MFWMGWGSHWYAWSSWQSIATLYWSILSSPWWFVTRDGKPLPTKLLMCLSYTTYRYISLLTCPPFSFSLGNPRCIRWGFGWCTWIIRQRRGASWCQMGLGSSGWIWVPFHVELGKKKLPSRPPVRTSIYIYISIWNLYLQLVRIIYALPLSYAEVRPFQRQGRSNLLGKRMHWKGPSHHLSKLQLYSVLSDNHLGLKHISWDRNYPQLLGVTRTNSATRSWNATRAVWHLSLLCETAWKLITNLLTAISFLICHWEIVG